MKAHKVYHCSDLGLLVLSVLHAICRSEIGAPVLHFANSRNMSLLVLQCGLSQNHFVCVKVFIHYEDINHSWITYRVTCRVVNPAFQGLWSTIESKTFIS